MRETRFKPSDDAELTVLNEREAVLVHLGRGLTYGLNKTGLLIWNNISEGLNVDDIVVRLCQNFNVEPEVALSKAAEFIAGLKALDLIEAVHADDFPRRTPQGE